MSIGLKNKKTGTLILVVIFGIVLGSYFNSLVRSLIPGDNNVVKTFFTTTVNFGLGSFGDGNGVKVAFESNDASKNMSKLSPLLIDLSAVKFQFGFVIKLSLMSIVGMFLSMYFFRWYS